jgi:uncharacterized protein YegP (UPF0339 family)
LGGLRKSVKYILVVILALRHLTNTTMPRFKVRQDSTCFWRFQLLTAAGAVLLEGNPYPIKESCKGAILSIKLAIAFDECFELLTDADHLYYFCIRSLGDGSLLGVSEKFRTKAACLQAMKVVREEIKIVVENG